MGRFDLQPAHWTALTRGARALVLACIVLGAAPASVARGESASWIADALRGAAAVELEPGRPHPAVARIVVPEPDGVTYGSGTLVDARGDYGLVLTNWHVVETARQEIRVEFPDGFRSAGRLLKVDKDWDLAAIAIWRPRCVPVPLSRNAPRPGEALTIAGYGNGPFRSAKGRCLQYVTPSLSLPSEMVQVTAAARNGDSGGPILNERGELAGVLFGTGEGVTSGSYCGRVSLFLANVVPQESPGSDSSECASTSNKRIETDDWDVPTAARRDPPSTTWDEPPSAAMQDFALLDEIGAPPVKSATEQGTPVNLVAVSEPPRENAADFTGTSVEEPAPQAAKDAPNMVSAAEAHDAREEYSRINWLALAGDTGMQRAKTALALVGLVTLLWQTMRVFSGVRPAHANGDE